MSLLNLNKRRIPYSLEPTLFIGGIANMISTPELLAERLDGIHPTEVINFHTVGDEVRCRLEYMVGIDNGNAGFGYFAVPQVYPTYIIHTDRYFRWVGQTALFRTGIKFVHLESLQEITRDAFRGTQIRIGYFPILYQFRYYRCFIENNKLERLYIPRCLTYVDNMFDASNVNLHKIYVHPDVLTMNAGGLPSSLQYAVDTHGTEIVPVTDYTKPNQITNLTVTNVTSTSLVVNFTPPTSVNPIDFYEVIVDDGSLLSKYKVHQEIMGSGAVIMELTGGVKNIKVRACDEFFNRGALSNSVQVFIDEQTTVEVLGFTHAGASSGIPIKSSHRLTFRNMNADGTVRESGYWSTEFPGSFTDFEEDGWIEIEANHYPITELEIDGYQLKTLAVSQFLSAVKLAFPNNHFTTVVLSSNADLEHFDGSNNPITSISGITTTQLTYLDLSNTSLTGSGISSILNNLVTIGTSYGTFLYTTKPNESGLEAYQTLISRGWTLSLAPDYGAIATLELLTYNTTLLEPSVFIALSTTIEVGLLDYRIIVNDAIVPSTGVVGGIEFLRPDTDVATGDWTVTPLWSKVNDSNDATVITSTNNNGSTATLSMTNVASSSTGSANDGILRFRARKLAGTALPDLLVEFLNGTTGSVLGSFTQTINTETLTEFQLSTPNVLTPEMDLQVRLTRSGGGNPQQRAAIEVSDIWLQVEVATGASVTVPAGTLLSNIMVNGVEVTATIVPDVHVTAEADILNYSISILDSVAEAKTIVQTTSETLIMTLLNVQVVANRNVIVPISSEAVVINTLDAVAVTSSSIAVTAAAGSQSLVVDVLDVVVQTITPLPTAPTNLQISNITPNGFTLSWTLGENAEDHVVYQRVQGTTTWVAVTSVGGQTNTYNYTNLVEGTTYEVKVRARNSRSIAESSIITATTASSSASITAAAGIQALAMNQLIPTVTTSSVVSVISAAGIQPYTIAQLNPTVNITASDPAFITEWQTDLGAAGSNQIHIPLASWLTYNFVVEWGDGTSNTITSPTAAALLHTYPAVGTYTVKITGTFPKLYSDWGAKIAKLKNIISWGNVQFSTDQESSFANAINLENIPAVTSVSINNLIYAPYMFNNSVKLKNIPGDMTLKAMTDGTGMFENVDLSIPSYTQLLINMAANNPNSNVTFHAGYSKYYASAQSARDNLTARGWIITDGGVSTLLTGELFKDGFENGLTNWNVGGEIDSSAASLADTGTSTISTDVAFEGSHSLKMTSTHGLNQDGQTNNNRYKELQENVDLIYNLKLYIPVAIDVAPWSPEVPNGFANFLQVKGVGDTYNDPLIAFGFEPIGGRGNGAGQVRFSFTFFGNLFPHFGMPKTEIEPSQIIGMPIGQWVDIKMRYFKHPTQGIIELWQDGVKIYNLHNIPTDPSGRAGHQYLYWSVNNYANSTTPATYSLYIDNVVISLPTGEPTPSVTASATTIGVNVNLLSPTVSVTTPPLPAPTNLVLSADGSTKITITWDAVTGAASYRARVTPTGGASTTYTASDTMIVLTGLTPDTDHFVEVWARDADLNPGGIVSGTVRTLPAPTPTGSLLDTYSGAVIALSLRRLKADYTGAILTVRRSSDNVEQEIGLGSNDELDTDALLAFVGDGAGYVTKWHDQINPLNSFSILNVSQQPQIVDYGQLTVKNGKPAIWFNGSQALPNSGSWNHQIPRSVTMHVAVFSANTKGSAQAPYGQRLTSASPTFMPQISTAGSMKFTQGMISGTTGVDATTPSGYINLTGQQQILTSHVDPDHATIIERNHLQINNQTVVKSNVYSNSPVPTQDMIHPETIGAQGYNAGTASSALNGTVQEVIIFVNNLRDSREDIRNSINLHYNTF